MNEKVGVLFLGVLFSTLGTLLIIASNDPKKNSLTRAIYGLWTFFPSPGPLKGEMWVVTSGIVYLFAGLFLLARFVYLLT
jgi:hypothetical protein